MQDFQLKDIPERKIFYVACRGPWRQLPEMLSSLFGHTAQGAVRTIGPPGAFYYNTPQEVDVQDLAWEVFYPIELDTPESINEKTGFDEKKIYSIINRLKAMGMVKSGGAWDLCEGVI